MLTPHQYLILKIILKNKSISGPKLRLELGNYAGPKYYNLMNRMVKEKLINKEYKNGKEKYILECEYTMTQKGIDQLNITKEFYK